MSNDSYKTRRRRVGEQALRAAAAKYADVAGVAEAVGVTVEHLHGLLEERPRLRKAFDRGRLLRNVRSLSSIGSSYEEAARTLGHDPEDFRRLVESDPELADLWQSARVATAQQLRASQLSQALAGNAASVKSVLERLQADAGPERLSLRAVRMNDTAELFGVTRQTVHAWATTGNCPRNADGTFPLRELIEWRSQQRIAAAGGVKAEPDADQRYRRAKAEQAEMELARLRGEVLDRRAVVAGLVARAWTLVVKLQGADIRLAADVQGKPAPAAAEYIAAWISDLLSAITETDLPGVLKSLPAEIAEELRRMLSRLAAGGFAS